jgi:hypothetical protein
MLSVGLKNVEQNPSLFTLPSVETVLSGDNNHPDQPSRLISLMDTAKLSNEDLIDLLFNSTFKTKFYTIVSNSVTLRHTAMRLSGLKKINELPKSFNAAKPVPLSLRKVMTQQETDLLTANATSLFEQYKDQMHCLIVQAYTNAATAREPRNLVNALNEELEQGLQKLSLDSTGENNEDFKRLLNIRYKQFLQELNVHHHNEINKIGQSSIKENIVEDEKDIRIRKLERQITELMKYRKSTVPPNHKVEKTKQPPNRKPAKNRKPVNKQKNYMLSSSIMINPPSKGDIRVTQETYSYIKEHAVQVIKRHIKLNRRPRRGYLPKIDMLLRTKELTEQETRLLQEYRYQATLHSLNKTNASLLPNQRVPRHHHSTPPRIKKNCIHGELNTLNGHMSQSSFHQVNNLTGLNLNINIMEFLNKNLKYIPKTEIKKTTLDTESNEFIRSLAIKDFFIGKNNNSSYTPEWSQFMLKNKNWTPPTIPECIKSFNLRTYIDSNRNKSDKQINIINGLLNNRKITICESDKNLGITLVNTHWYLKEIHDQMKDTNTYEAKWPNINEISEKILLCTNIIKSLISDKVADYVKSFIKDWRLPRFYIIPKIHKTPLKGRPIVPSHKWITAGLSSVIDKLLRPTLEKCETVLKDSRELIKIIESMNFNNNISLSTSDVVSLYTNIQIDDCIKRIIKVYIDKNPLDIKNKDSIKTRNLTVKLLKEGLNTILKENYFITPEGVIYHQKIGLAMGTPIAPLLANIYMYSIETEYMKKLNIKPLLYNRYIDDIIMILDNNHNPTDFLYGITNDIPSLKFTTIVNSDRIPFLDLLLYKGKRFKTKGIIDLKTYEKELNKYLYIPYDSEHPMNLKKGFIKAETIRQARNCSDINVFNDQLRKFRRRLMERGYSYKLISKMFNTVNYNDRTNFINGVNKTDDNTLFLPLTYTSSLNKEQLEENLRKILEELRKTNTNWENIPKISLSFKSSRNLKRIIGDYYNKTRYDALRIIEDDLKKKYAVRSQNKRTHDIETWGYKKVRLM